MAKFVKYQNGGSPDNLKKNIKTGGLKTDAELMAADKAKQAVVNKQSLGKGMTDKERLNNDAKKKKMKTGKRGMMARFKKVNG